ncbi:hypothetical protein IAI18_18305 [Acetobacteraceae bacterium H6797]|nr:hypothetical protein [Acetobacteraceae bacterium H6797]
MAEKATIFADGILEAHVASGVARISLAQTGSDGKPVPSGQLIVPLAQLPAMAKGLGNLLQQIEGKAKQVQQQQQAAGHTQPGAFRFSG